MPFFRKWVLGNWGLKLLALASSFALWAIYTAEPLAEAAFEAPVIFRNMPADTDLSGEVAWQARVVLRGRAAVLRRLHPEDLALNVDLAGRSQGEFTITLGPDQLEVPLGAEVARITPGEVRVRLVPR